MRSIFIFLILISSIYISQAQGVAINNTGQKADTCAILDLSSNNTGLLLPRMDETQRNAIVNPKDGLMIFNTSSKCFNVYKNSIWYEMCGTCTPPSTPGAITGITTVCSGQSGESYSIAAVSGATSYYWTVPSGASITSGQNTTNITVDFGSTSGSISVAAINSCDTGSYNSSSITVGSTLNAGTIGGGSSAVCGSGGVTDDPAAFTNTASASGGLGTITYQWQSKPVAGSYTDIPGATGLTYDPGPISQSTVYSRKATDTCTTVTSNEMTVTYSASCGYGVCQNAGVVHSSTVSVDHMELLGMKFTPVVNGVISQLGLRIPDNGTFQLNLFDCATHNLLRTAYVTATANTWCYASITPYNINSGQSVYCVLVLPAWDIYAYGYASMPILSGNVNIDGGCWYNSPPGPNEYPTSYGGGQIYGVTDIVFAP